mmetsp:Transcript_35972/g.101290  ORF Transcript_35972/g.101290 Transcript_35972/m.101290 type:complete len:364 (-) Transcript_35972:221-1312(-)
MYAIRSGISPMFLEIQAASSRLFFCVSIRGVSFPAGGPSFCRVVPLEPIVPENPGAELSSARRFGSTIALVSSRCVCVLSHMPRTLSRPVFSAPIASTDFPWFSSSSCSWLRVPVEKARVSAADALSLPKSSFSSSNSLSVLPWLNTCLLNSESNLSMPACSFDMSFFVASMLLWSFMTTPFVISRFDFVASALPDSSAICLLCFEALAESLPTSSLDSLAPAVSCLMLWVCSASSFLETSWSRDSCATLRMFPFSFDPISEIVLLMRSSRSARRRLMSAPFFPTSVFRQCTFVFVIFWPSRSCPMPSWAFSMPPFSWAHAMVERPDSETTAPSRPFWTSKSACIAVMVLLPLLSWLLNWLTS